MYCGRGYCNVLWSWVLHCTVVVGIALYYSRGYRIVLWSWGLRCMTVCAARHGQGIAQQGEGAVVQARHGEA